MSEEGLGLLDIKPEIKFFWPSICGISILKQILYGFDGFIITTYLSIQHGFQKLGKLPPRSGNLFSL
jgi:hypothetical protein